MAEIVKRLARVHPLVAVRIAMAADTAMERAELWQRLEVALPDAVAVLREALNRRVLGAAEDPLRNRLVRKLLHGHDPARLIAQFETAAALLRNWDGFACGMAERHGADFDAQLTPWMAEVRGLWFLREHRRAVTATAIPREPGHKTPDFIVHREGRDGLAEVKLVTPNNNFDTLEEELEIAALRWPDVFDRRLYIVRTPDDRDATLSDEPQALATFIEQLRAAICADRGCVAHAWRTDAGTGCEVAVLEIHPHVNFAMIGEGVGGCLDDEFHRHWLEPFQTRLVTKSNEALTQMRKYETWRGTPYAEKDIVIFYQEPGAGAATLLLNDDVNRIKATVAADLRALDPGVTLSVRS